MATTKKARPPKATISVEAPALGAHHERPPSSIDTPPLPGQFKEPAGSTVAGRSATGDGSVVGGIENALTGTARSVGSLLPNRLPVILGFAALLAVGVLEPPVALAGGLAYEALRRWQLDGPRRR